VTYAERTGAVKNATIHLVENPHLEVVPVESAGTITPAQQAFRDRWLKSRS